MSQHSYLASLPARTEVPVFFFDQDRSWEKPAGLRPRAECRELKEKGLGRFVDNGRAFQLAKLMPFEAKVARVAPPSNSPESESAISTREMRANAGDGHPGLVGFAREKVSQWKRRDAKQRAVVARGRWMAAQRIEIVATL